MKHKRDEETGLYRRPLRATKWQRMARAAYSGGMHDHLSREQFDSAGDSLFTFIMSELDEDCKDFDEALRRLEQARDDIEGVINALLRKG